MLSPSFAFKTYSKAFFAGSQHPWTPTKLIFNLKSLLIIVLYRDLRILLRKSAGAVEGSE